MVLTMKIRYVTYDDGNDNDTLVIVVIITVVVSCTNIDNVDISFKGKKLNSCLSL